MTDLTRRISHPHHLKRHYASWQLKLLTGKHTGKRVHHQHTSYPALTILLLVAGLVLFQTTVSTYAATQISVNIYNPNPVVPSVEQNDLMSSPDNLQIIDWAWVVFGVLGAFAIMLWLSELNARHVPLLMAGRNRHHYRH